MIAQRIESTGGQLVREIRTRRGSFVSEIENRSDGKLDVVQKWWQSYLRGASVEAQAVKRVRPLRVVDTFCGCGGLTLGVREAAAALGRAVQSVAGIDLDRNALDVYEHNFSGAQSVAQNVSTLVDFHVNGRGAGARFQYPPEVLDQRLSGTGKVDLFLAGPPCQGHSNLNNRTRREDPRNLLYLTAVALGVAMKSTAIILENVPDITRDRSDVVSTAKALLASSGYSHIDSGVLAADMLGGAQSRRRFFLVAVSRAVRSKPIPLTLIRQAFHHSPNAVEWAIGDLLDRPGVGVMNTTPALSEENLRRIDFLFHRNLYDLPDAVRPECHRAGTTYRAVYGRLNWDKPAQTITTGFLTPGRGRFIHPLRQRVLTPLEAARLQCFPDSFHFVNGGLEPSRLSLTKWIGDAVPPLLGFAAAIGAIAAIPE